MEITDNQNQISQSHPKILYEIESNFNRIKVIEEFPIRKLIFGDGGMCSEQSAINIEKLHDNVFDYSILLMHSFLFVKEPLDVLVIGLGGGVIPRQISQYFISSKVDVIEIDPEVINIAKSFFFFEETDKVKVCNGDAFAILSETNKKYDIIILDAFNSKYTPFHLMSKEFFQYVLRASKDQCVISSNMCNAYNSYRSQLNTMRSVLGDDIYYIDGPRNRFTTITYFIRGGLSPVRISNKSCHFLGIRPLPMTITEEIKSAKIFSILSP